MAGLVRLVPAIHAGVLQKRIRHWRGPLQEPTNAKVFGLCSANLLVLEAPNRVDGRGRHDHDANPPRATFSEAPN